MSSKTLIVSAIAAQSYSLHAKPLVSEPSRHHSANNYVDDVGGDGIVPWATDSVPAEDNISSAWIGFAGPEAITRYLALGAPTISALSIE